MATSASLKRTGEEGGGHYLSLEKEGKVATSASFNGRREEWPQEQGDTQEQAQQQQEPYMHQLLLRERGNGLPPLLLLR